MPAVADPLPEFFTRLMEDTAARVSKGAYERGVREERERLVKAGLLSLSPDGHEPGSIDPDQHLGALVRYAAIVLAEHGHMAGESVEKQLDALAEATKDPAKLRGLFKSAELSWVMFTTARNTVGAEWDGPESRKKLYGERARRALEGQRKRGNKEASGRAAHHLAMKAMYGDASPDEIRDLVDHLPSLSVEQLRNARGMLGASFKDARRRDDMVRALISHAAKMAAKLDAADTPEFDLDNSGREDEITLDNGSKNDRTIEGEPPPGESNGRLEGQGEGGQGGGLPAGQPVGDAVAEAPDAILPGTGSGVAGGGRPGSLHPDADGGGDGLRGKAGGRRDRSVREPRTGDGATTSVAGGRDRPAGGVGDGSGAGGDDGSRPESPVEESLAEPPTPDNPTDLAAGNWRYADREFAAGGLKAKFAANIAAIKTLRTIQAEGRDTATPEEQAVMAKFVGWGQFPAVFNTWGTHGGEDSHNWRAEREQLKSLLSDDEWNAGLRSTLNAHYTAPAVVDAHWKMAERLGFKGGRFLETSAGIGYYLGLMPEHLAASTRASAVELDPTTGAMLKMLYPKTNVQVQGFQNFQSPPDFYDLVASNVPFGDYKVHDPDYNKHQANIHDYFFLKSADKVRPGGLVMHITSTGTMDKGDSAIREELAKTCDLVSAIRFPAGAHKGNAGTEVVTDLLVLRKRLPGELPADQTEPPAEAVPQGRGFTGVTTDSLGRQYHWKDGVRVPGPDWTKTTTVPDPAGGEPIPVNEYFAANPDQILGTLDRTGAMYRGNAVNVSKTADYEDRLTKAIERLPQGVMQPLKAPPKRFAPEVMPAPGEVKDGGFHIDKGKVFVREGGALVEQAGLKPKDVARLQGHLEVRDAVRAVLNAQLAGQDATAARATLNKVYDAFAKKHGFMNDAANKRAFRSDPDAPVLLALEKYDPKAKKGEKADIFHKDTISAVKPATHAATVGEALGISLYETGRVDIEHMGKLLGHHPKRVAKALAEEGIAFQDPSEGWKPADQYLSGNVRRKLVLARAAAAADPKYAANVAALEKVQPDDVEHHEIDVKLGAAWVPPSDVSEFAASLLSGSADDFKISHMPESGAWFANFSKSGERMLRHRRTTKEAWGTPDVEFMELLEAGLNNTSVQVTRKDSEGKSYVDKKATDDAMAKVQEIKDRFKEWIWTDDARRERLHRHYNDRFNNVRPMAYDGSHQKFPGMNPAVQLRDHQKNFVWQVVTTGKGLAAHEVGTGKTFSMIAAAMELRRLGLARKPAIACLKANVEAITNDALKLYPGAKILSTADMFDAASRKKTISQIATGDYDLIILTHDHLDLLQMKPETVKSYIEEELKELEAAKAAAEAEDPKKGNRVVKALAKAKERLEAKLQEALDGTKKDDAVYFEETGVDHIFVDEAHKYKSLPCYTKQNRLKGIPTSRSDRATAMQMRTRWLMEQNGGRGVVFATGTPVANTMAELYNMQRYLQPEELKERGIQSFDAWASTFGDVETKMEFTVSGEYKPVSRFAKFVNIPELMQTVRQVMDVQRADNMVNTDGTATINRPRRKDTVIAAPKSEAIAKLMEDLQKRAKNLKQGEKDNMLVICTDGRKGALDMRLVDPTAEDDPESKTNKAIANVLRLHKEKPGTTQLIFSDIGVNPTDSGFSLYGDIIDKLVAGGIPREKIADFSKLEGAKKEAVMDAMRKGDIVIGIGSTEKLGTGVNVQQKLAALHHLDVPWLPSSVEQRDGRAWRQGNENKDVGIYRYVTEGSLDQTFWQIIGNKTRFIKQIVTPGRSTARVAAEEDAEELSPDELMAAASGDPRILQKVQLDKDVQDLRAAQQRHEREQVKIKDAANAAERKLPYMTSQSAKIKADAEHLERNPDFHLDIGGKVFAERKDAAEPLAQTLKDVRNPYGYGERIGKFRGMELVKRGEQLLLRGATGEEYKTGDSLQSIEYVARNIAAKAADAEKEIQRHREDIERLRGSLGKPFAKADELKAKAERAKRLEDDLAGKTIPHGYSEGDAVTLADGRHVTIVGALHGRVTVEHEGKRTEIHADDLPKPASKAASLSHAAGNQRPGTLGEAGDLLKYAMLLLQEHGHVTGNDVEGRIDALAEMAKDPAKLKELLASQSDLLSWVAAQSRGGGTKAVWEGEGQRKALYGERARRALDGQKKRGDKAASASKAHKIATSSMYGEATAADLRELADHLPSLTVEQLNNARAMLGARFGDARRRDDKVRNLIEHATRMAEELDNGGEEDSTPEPTYPKGRLFEPDGYAPPQNDHHEKLDAVFGQVRRAFPDSGVQDTDGPFDDRLASLSALDRHVDRMLSPESDVRSLRHRYEPLTDLRREHVDSVAKLADLDTNDPESVNDAIAIHADGIRGAVNEGHTVADHLHAAGHVAEAAAYRKVIDRVAEAAKASFAEQAKDAGQKAVPEESKPESTEAAAATAPAGKPASARPVSAMNSKDARPGGQGAEAMTPQQTVDKWEAAAASHLKDYEKRAYQESGQAPHGVYLVDMPVDMLEPGNAVSPRRLKEIEDQGGNDSPGEVDADRDENGTVVYRVDDGNHRLALAKKRGDKTIPMIVKPQDADVMPELAKTIFQLDIAPVTPPAGPAKPK